MPPIAENLTGRRFGRLIVVSATKQGGKTAWLCHCECGAHKVTMASSLRHGLTKSCGCIHREVMQAIQTTHGLSMTPECGVWRGMKRRCYDTKTVNFERYGGRGITICDRWRNDLAAFYADMGPRPSASHSIERRDNERGYSPDNCYWATSREQALNRRPKRK